MFLLNFQFGKIKGMGILMKDFPENYSVMKNSIMLDY